MKIAISADSVLDLTPALLKEYDIKVIPLGIVLGGEDYLDDGSVTPEGIFKYVEETKVLPKTNAANSESYKERFQAILDEGYDCIIHFNLSSDLSATHNNAVTAAKEFGGKVRVINSKSLSTGVGIQAMYARKLTETESDIDVIIEKIED